MSPGIMLLIGLLLVLYGLIVGGTWVRRTPENIWDTASTIIFTIIAAVATIHLVYVGARQGEAFNKAKDRLDCVAEQLAAVRVQAPMPDCRVQWDD
jgi:uncharacterized membrane protein